MSGNKALILRYSNTGQNDSNALYQEAVKSGYIGTYEEFISHLATTPSINGVALKDDTTASDLGLVTKEEINKLFTVNGETIIITK